MGNAPKKHMKGELIIFGLAQLEKSVWSIERKIDRILEVIEKYEEEAEEWRDT